MESGKKLKIQPLNEFHNLQTNLIPDERSSRVTMQIGVNEKVRVIVW
jgi:hypothetical protein